jgi:cytochrome c oxidase subunit 2
MDWFRRWCILRRDEPIGTPIMILLRLCALLLLAGGALAGITAAHAAAPAPWEMGLQPAATPVMRDLDSLHTFLLAIITVITLFVLLLLGIVIVKFRASKNPTPSRSTHNTLVEVVWTVIPVIILVIIAIPSFRLLYHEDVVPKADFTIKAIGHQWYWSYEYPDHGKFAFDATIVPDDKLKPGDKRLLEVDNRIVVPVNATVELLVTADDVIHSWAIPAFGVKIDAIPGKVNHSWFKVEREGVYYGQCSELCGTNHALMPIAVEVVSQQKFDQWVADARRKFAANGDEPRIVASAAERQ